MKPSSIRRVCRILSRILRRTYLGDDFGRDRGKNRGLPGHTLSGENSPSAQEPAPPAREGEEIRKPLISLTAGIPALEQNQQLT